MSSYASPTFPAGEISRFLSDNGLAAVKPDDLAAPSSDFVVSVFSNILAYLDPAGFDPDSQVDFMCLELLENPDYHSESIRKAHLFQRMKCLLSSIQHDNFFVRDLARPDPRRTAEILSAIINFLLHREEKMKMLQPIVDQLSSSEERRAEAEEKISEINKKILEHEAAREMDQPVVQQIDAEVKDLRQILNARNKEQMTLKTRAIGLKEKTEALTNKIQQFNFELSRNAQENSKLLSKIVQSPDKLQRNLEEKKANRTEVMNAERSAMLSFKERSSKLEVYSKALEKISRHREKMEALQEQVNSTKALDKDVKNLRAKLNDEELLSRSIEAQIIEAQGKAKQALELVKGVEKERDVKLAEQSKKLESVKSEMELKLQPLDQRELKAEAIVTKGEILRTEADSIRGSGKAQEIALLSLCERIKDEYLKYADVLDPIFQKVDEC